MEVRAKPPPRRSRLWSFATLLPTGLLVVCGMVWVRGYFVTDTLVVFLPRSAQYSLRSNMGMMQFQFSDEHPSHVRPEVKHLRLAWRTGVPGPVFGEPTAWQRRGFDLYVSPYASRKAVRVILPWWLLAPVAALPATWQAVSALRRRQRHVAVRCASCGYDLRTLIGGRCPECGEAAESVGSPAKPEPGGRA